MSDHGAAQDISAQTQQTQSASGFGTVRLKCNHGDSPQSSEPIGPQQRTWGKFGQGLTEEEEGNCTPMLRAKLLNQLKQNTTCNTVVRNLSNLTDFIHVSLLWLRFSCTSVLWWQATEEGSDKDFEFYPQLWTVSYTLTS